MNLRDKAIALMEKNKVKEPVEFDYGIVHWTRFGAE